MMKQLNCFFLLIVLTMITCSAFAADEFQSLDLTKNLVRKFLETQLKTISQEEINIEIGYLDPRLKLPMCSEQQLKFSIPNNNDPLRASTVHVYCDMQTAWSIYVPVKVKMMVPVFVSARQIMKGENIHPTDLKIVSVDVNQLPQGYIKDISQTTNKIAKQNLQAGAPLKPEHLANPELIHHGDIVTIVAQINQVLVQNPGVALNNGGEGDRIKVQNLKSKKILDGQITASKTVKVLARRN